MGFIVNKGHTHDEGMLRFNPNLQATLGASGSNECKGGQLMDGVTKECTTLLTFYCNANKCATYNIWSSSKPNTWQPYARASMKAAPTSQMLKMCIVLIFKGRNYESIPILKTRIQRKLKNKHVLIMISNIQELGGEHVSSSTCINAWLWSCAPF